MRPDSRSGPGNRQRSAESPPLATVCRPRGSARPSIHPRLPPPWHCHPQPGDHPASRARTQTTAGLKPPDGAVRLVKGLPLPKGGSSHDGTSFDHSPRASSLLTVLEKQFQLLRDVLVLALPTCVELDGDPGCVLNSLRCAVRCVPLQQPAKRGVRPKVRVAECVGDVDVAIGKTRADNDHGLVVVGGQTPAVLAVPLLGDVVRGCQVVDSLHLLAPAAFLILLRSEERRVGKECRSRWSPYH